VIANHPLIWLLFAACLVLSFILSGMEAGVLALSRLRIRQLMRAGKRSATVLYHYLEHPENFLWTILVGNTVANFIILGWLIIRLQQGLRGHHFLFMAVFGVAVFFFYACFDLLPKMFFRSFPNRLCLLLARPFRVIHLLLLPLVALVEGFSSLLLRWRGGKTFTGHLFGNREELRLMMQESAQGFSSEERAMINRVLDLQVLTVRQAMKPLSQAITVTAQTPLKEVLGLSRERQVTRVPVWDKRENRERIIGLVVLNSLLYRADLDPSRLAGAYVQPALYLEEDTRLEVALRRMQRSGQRLAIVLGRDGRESGILSLEDVLNVIFGAVKL
jgi:CBS domain containing-hemolysin-like protein